MAILKAVSIRFVNSNLKQLFKWAFYSALAGPTSIVLHEIGHALSALFLGYADIRITYHSVDRVPPLDIKQWEMAITSEAGPIASLIVIVCCYAILRLRKQSFFISTLGIMATMQFTGGVLYVIGIIFGVTSLTEFDGARFAQYLNIPIYIPAVVELLIFVGSWVYFAKSIETNKRKTAIIGTISGGIVGIVVWLTLLGPIVLPE